MASIKKINAGGTTYDIDASSWKGYTNLKTINNKSLFGSGNIEPLYVFDIINFLESISPGGLDASIDVETTIDWRYNGSIGVILDIFKDYLEDNKSTLNDIHIYFGGIYLPTRIYEKDGYMCIDIYTTVDVLDNYPSLYNILHGKLKFSCEDIFNGLTNATAFEMSGQLNVLLTLSDIATINGNSLVGGGNIDTTPTLKTINGQSLFGNGDIRTNIYCTCNSARNSSIKTIDISNVSLMDGMHIWINFTNGHDEFDRNNGVAMIAKITHAGGTLETVPILFKGINGGLINAQNGYNGYYFQPFFGSGIYEFILCKPSTQLPAWTLNFTGSHTSIKEPFICMKKSTITSNNIDNIYSVLREGIHVKFDDTISSLLSVVSNSGLYKSDCSFEFTTGTTAPTLTLPSAWKWANGIVPHIKANKRYHVSVKNNCAVIAEFDVDATS